MALFPIDSSPLNRLMMKISLKIVNFISNNLKFFYMSSSDDLIRRLEYYISNVVIIWIAMIFYRTNRYYVGFLRQDTQDALLYLAVAYTVLGLIIYVLFPLKDIRESKGSVVIKTLRRLFADTREYLKKFTYNPDHPTPKIDLQGKTAVLFTLVKVFFLPLLLNFFFGNYSHSIDMLLVLLRDGKEINIDSFNRLIFPFLMSLFFAIDTAYYAFGYSFEAGFLGNKVRSVEPTFLGWIVALMCYPPFNTFVTDNYTGWYVNDYVNFSSANITFLIRVMILSCYVIYVSASIALGAKCSNLTNRGIVTSGPYAIVRHPAYISKNFAWWLTVLPLLNLANPGELVMILAATSFWTFIYYLRAITEERHLIKDPDYVQYCSKVRYRFIPYIY
jgi:protein-S-isoprenylcysteine O-methyltransferase Ste14